MRKHIKKVGIAAMRQKGMVVSASDCKNYTPIAFDSIEQACLHQAFIPATERSVPR